jgi:hypothetical protein
LRLILQRGNLSAAACTVGNGESDVRDGVEHSKIDIINV